MIPFLSGYFVTILQSKSFMKVLSRTGMQKNLEDRKHDLPAAL